MRRRNAISRKSVFSLPNLSQTDVALDFHGGCRSVFALVVTTVLLCAFAARPAHGQIALVQNLGTAQVKATGTTLSIPPIVTAVRDGNSIIVTVAMDNVAGPVTCSDNSGGAHTYNVDVDVAFGGVRTVICSAHDVRNVDAGRVIGVSHPSAVARAMSVSEFAGLAKTSPLDQTAAGTGSNNNPTTSAATTTVDRELLIGAIGVNGPVGDSFTPTAPWMALPRNGTSGGGTDITINPEYQIAGKVGTYRAEGTITPANWAAAMATYKVDPFAPTALFSKVGTFQATGPTQSVTGVGFWPKAVIFFWTSQAAPGFAPHAAAGYGFAADDLSQRAVLFAEDDDVSSPDFNAKSQQTQTACILVATASPPSGGVTAKGQLTGMTGDGFKLSWNVAPSSPWLIHYLAIGGGDVTDATVRTSQPSACTLTPCGGAYPTGELESFTGLAFEPDFLMFLSIDNDTNDVWVTGAGVETGGKVSIGFAGRSGGTITQGAIAATSRARMQVDAQTSVWQMVDRALLEKDTRWDSRDFEARVTSFDPTGFTLNKLINTAGTETDFHYLALKGGRYHVGTLAKPAGTEPGFPDLGYTGTGFRPHGLLFFSWNLISAGAVPTIYDNARISFSAADTRINQAATFFGSQTDDPSDADNSWVRQGTSTSRVIYLAQPGDCPPNPLWSPEPGNSAQCWNNARLIADADVFSYDADGFTLKWTTVDNFNVNDPADENDAEIICVAFGNTTTAVDLASFAATGLDSEVLLEWETGSEVDNVGFHLYRSESEEGPYERITETYIPGLGFSVLGARYRYVDTGLVNGRTYYYELEDFEWDGKSKRHGPVWATPAAGASTQETGSPVPPKSQITYGEPEATSFQVLHPNRHEVVLELLTEGFVAEPQSDGSVELSVPGFTHDGEPGAPAIPVKRAWVEAWAGRDVRIASVSATDVTAFSLRPSSADASAIEASRQGTVRVARRSRPARRGFRGEGLYPDEAARLLSVGFQEDVKKALVELAPLRWDRSSGQLLLARRLVVRLVFEGRVAEERSLGGSRGRRLPKRGLSADGNVVAHLASVRSGLYGVRFEDIFGRRRQGVTTSELRLSRQGETVAYHIEPASPAALFGPGSVLYFLSEGEKLNPYGPEAVYELELGAQGQIMPVGSATPSGEAVSHYGKTLELEENHLYTTTLPSESLLWLWDFLLAPAMKSYPFEVDALAPATAGSRLRVWLSGMTDLPTNLDHHVRVYLNGSLLQERYWDGLQPWTLETELLPGVLREGQNLLQIENVGDTAAFSRVVLDRFEVRYPRRLAAESGMLRGSFDESGQARVAGLDGEVHVVDLTETPARWLSGAERSGSELRFRAEAGRHYLVVDSRAVVHPEVRSPSASRLKRPLPGAEYVVVGPRSFLEVAEPLLDHRRRQGLSTQAVPIEQVYAEFGHGESPPQAVRDFLAYAYHYWKTPPRYVLLFGDATFDFKDYLGTGFLNRVPPLILKTTYLWTASDPTYAAVNGDDLLPDVALGRLPAASLQEARLLIDKILAYESAEMELSGRAVLVADQPDEAGDFVANAEEIASSFLSGRDVRKIYQSDLGTAATHQAILQAFDEGASLMSYIGHGGVQIWGKNILNVNHVASLGFQSQQPLLLTLNCMNGFFHLPAVDSLSEALLKAEGKGAIAAFSPSGMSLNSSAHLYHKALVQELVQGDHDRLGDALLAAQARYADTGAFPELLSIYHLLGDPALKLR